MNTVKHKEAKISIVFPHLVNDHKAIINEVRSREKVDSMYFIFPNEETGELEVSGLIDEDLIDIYSIMLVDRNIDGEVIEYYTQIITYYNATDEDLLIDEENNINEYEIRSNEVETKWFNGNYNYWIFE